MSAEPPTPAPPEPPPLSGLFRLAVLGTGVGFGVALASLYSLKRTPTGLAFEFRAGTIPVFVVGAAAGWVFWKMLIKLHTPVAGQAGASRKKLVVFYLLWLLAGMGLFLYPITFLNQGEYFSDVSLGMLFGFLAASVGGLFLWRTIRFLEEDTRRWGGKDEP